MFYVFVKTGSANIAAEADEQHSLMSSLPDLIVKSADDDGRVTSASSETAISISVHDSIPAPTIIKVKEKNAKESELWLENMEFDSTIRSCLSSDCFDDPVKMDDGVKRTRIGLLSPDSRGMHIFSQMLHQAINKNVNDTYNFEHDTHVPPYGYGKNHGWSKIIRLVSRLAPHAQDLLMTKHKSDRVDYSQGNQIHQVNVKVNPVLYEKQLRQLIRWHCRLSHVAAHTAMLTIFLDDLMIRPAVEIYKILSFLDMKPGRKEIMSAIDTSFDRLQHEMNVPAVTGMSIDYSLNEELIDVAIQTIKSEMESTQDLQKWPCKNFRELDTQELPMNSAALAANCSGTYVTCSVPVDKRGG